MTKDERWYGNYEALRVYILERGHLPDKHMVENRAMLSWAKYQRKKITAGTMEPECQRLFEELMAMRCGEHTGGRKRLKD